VFPVYDDYKFLTRSELDGLGLSHLIGTDFVRAYMHGFFLDVRLYRKVTTDVWSFERLILLIVIIVTSARLVILSICVDYGFSFFSGNCVISIF